MVEATVAIIPIAISTANLHISLTSKDIIY